MTFALFFSRIPAFMPFSSRTAGFTRWPLCFLRPASPHLQSPPHRATYGCRDSDGNMTDPLGSAVYNARIDLMTVNGVVLQSHGHTDGRGQYIIYVYLPGRYEVRVVATGFNDN